MWNLHLIFYVLAQLPSSAVRMKRKLQMHLWCVWHKPSWQCHFTLVKPVQTPLNFALSNITFNFSRGDKRFPNSSEVNKTALKLLWASWEEISWKLLAFNLLWIDWFSRNLNLNIHTFISVVILQGIFSYCKLKILPIRTDFFVMKLGEILLKLNIPERSLLLETITEVCRLY